MKFNGKPTTSLTIPGSTIEQYLWRRGTRTLITVTINSTACDAITMESLELELFKAATAQRLFGEPGCPVSSMTSFDVMRFPAQDLWDPRVHSALRMKMNKPVLLFCRSDHRLARKAPCPGGVTATFVTLESTRRRATGIFVSSERNLLVEPARL